jgi:hypothetical protein
LQNCTSVPEAVVVTLNNVDDSGSRTSEFWLDVAEFSFCAATDCACFKYLHGGEILVTAGSLIAYTLYKMTFDAELTEPFTNSTFVILLWEDSADSLLWLLASV